MTSPRHRALCEIAAGAVDRIRFRQRLLKLQRNNVEEEDHEPDGQIGMAGLRQDPHGYADAMAAQGAATDCFPREGSITEHLLGERR